MRHSPEGSDERRWTDTAGAGTRYLCHATRAGPLSRRWAKPLIRSFVKCSVVLCLCECSPAGSGGPGAVAVCVRFSGNEKHTHTRYTHFIFLELLSSTHMRNRKLHSDAAHKKQHNAN